jgi:hypothetical protein
MRLYSLIFRIRCVPSGTFAWKKAAKLLPEFPDDLKVQLALLNINMDLAEILLWGWKLEQTYSGLGPVAGFGISCVET